MVGLGVKRENVFMCGSKGVVREGRGDRLDESKQRYCQRTEARTLADVVKGADVFLDCSAAGVLSVEMVTTMARQPIILALAKPILVGRPEVIKMRLQRSGLRLQPGRDFELVDPENDPRFRSYWETYHQIMGREGMTPEAAKAAVRRSNTLISSLMLRRGEARALICGLVGRFDSHLEHVQHVVGLQPGVQTAAAMNALTLDKHRLFIADTFVNEEPGAEELADIALMAAAEVRRFGLPPKVAFVSHSIFGSSSRASARRMRAARDIFVGHAPDIECDGEMHGDAALSETVRQSYLPESTLSGSANLLMLPNLDAANILFNVLKMTGGNGVTVGPILLGTAKPAHILTPSATVRRVVNMTALAVADVSGVTDDTTAS